MITKSPRTEMVTETLIELGLRWWNSFEEPDKPDMEELFELLATRNLKGLQELIKNLNAEED